MSLRYKKLEDIDKSDLQSLKENEVSEDKYIEYKQFLPGDKIDDKKKFLASVSSFANASGGDLIFGIEEEEGIPVNIHGLKNINVDKEIQRLESIIRDGVEPRIPGVIIQEIKLDNSNFIFIVRIPRSWALPHMVSIGGYTEFYSRDSRGKHKLDVQEIRGLFELSGNITDRIKNFRAERIGNILAAEAPVALLDDSPKIILHLIPLGAFDPESKFDLTFLDENPILLEPIDTSGWDHRYNLDGIISYTKSPNSNFAYSYLQVFRNGIIESVDTSILGRGIKDDTPIIPSLYEVELVRLLPSYFNIQRRLGVEPPIFIMLSFICVFGYTVVHSKHKFPRVFEKNKIDRDNLLISEVVVDSFDVKPAEVMKPIFDAVWNASGYTRSMNYDENGYWIGQ